MGNLSLTSFEQRASMGEWWNVLALLVETSVRRLTSFDSGPFRLLGRILMDLVGSD